MMKLTIVFWACIFFANNIGAQDLKKDFLLVYDNYLKMDYYTQDVLVCSFQKKEDTKPFYQKKGKIVKGKGMYYSFFNGQKTIINKGEMLYIYEDTKQIMYYDAGKFDETVLAKQYQQVLDSMKGKDIVYLGNKDNVKTYRINDPNQLITSTEISLDMTTMLLKKVVYYYKITGEYEGSQYKSTIDYTLVSKNEPSASWFDLGKYITVKNKRATLQPDYSSYHLTQKEEKTMDLNKIH